MAKPTRFLQRKNASHSASPEGRCLMRFAQAKRTLSVNVALQATSDAFSGRKMHNAQIGKPLSRLEHSLTYGNIWLAIFPLLKKKKEYAYALPSEIEREFGFRPGKIMTYLVLYKLEAEGLIEAKFQGRRKYYCLTQRGKGCAAGGKKMLLKFAKRL